MVLQRWGRVDIFPAVLQLIAVRENGPCCFSERSVCSSSSFRWLCGCVELELPKLLARSLLLISPSVTMPLDNNHAVHLRSCDQDVNASGVDRFDGMSFISPSLACVALGVDVQHIRYLDPPFQFRGFFYSTVILTSSCVKARRPGFCDDLLYGIDVTKVFNCVFNEPTVNGDVLSSLHLRVCAVREVGARARALSLYNKFAQECKDHA